MDDNGPAERQESLWLLIAGPSIWAAHFLLCYVTAAVWCAKFAEPWGSLGAVRTAVAIYTVVAVAAIGVSLVHAYRRHEFGQATLPHDYDTAADRHRFLGFATLLLSGLSLVSTLYVGAAAWFIGSCG